MKVVNILIISVIVLLSIAASLAKVLQTEQEMVFLQGFGFSSVLIIAFGMVQIAGGILLVPSGTRLYGGILTASALLVSTLLIFAGGNMVFGLVSTIPTALTCVIIYQSARVAHRNSLNASTGETGVG